MPSSPSFGEWLARWESTAVRRHVGPSRLKSIAIFTLRSPVTSEFQLIHRFFATLVFGGLYATRASLGLRICYRQFRVRRLSAGTAVGVAGCQFSKAPTAIRNISAWQFSDRQQMQYPQRVVRNSSSLSRLVVP